MRSHDDERLLRSAAYNAALRSYPLCPLCERRLAHRPDCPRNPLVIARNRRTAHILLGIIIASCVIAAGSTLLAFAQGWV